ncbi:MAG: NAD(P)-dependent glycerol-3-phosphate dehydrogenase [Lachnospiraceae bacterium]|nr:NAD(P)-dependent glycerol-3-phosphate dehydrogenase [Lachnospiraceae bacterium]
MFRKVAVLGAGTWGTALAIQLAENDNQVTLWSKLPREIEALRADRKKVPNLPDAVLQDSVILTTDLEEACKDKDLIVFAVASPYVRSTAELAKPFIPDGQVIVNVAKGIEESTMMTLTEVISDVIPGAETGVLSGPSHAEEVGRDIPTAVVVGAKNHKTAVMIQDTFMNDYFRIYINPDVIGIELGGSLKNVIALAAGVVDGLGLGDNTKAALMTRGLAEISRLGVAMGGNLETFLGLSGMGDLIVTCTSLHSRNHNAGYLIGKGYTMQEAMDEVKQVVEGVYSAKAALLLAKKYKVEMPIVEQVNKVLFEGKTAQEALADLFTRERQEEVMWEEEKK